MENCMYFKFPNHLKALGIRLSQNMVWLRVEIVNTLIIRFNDQALE